jgi:hypothetical protein
MKCFIFILLFFFVRDSKAQDSVVTKCTSQKVFYKAERAAFFKQGNDSLRSFFASNIALMNLPEASGKIVLQLIVDNNGRVCLFSFDNKTNKQVSEPGIRMVLSRMPRWTPAFQNGYDVDYFTRIELVLQQGIVLKAGLAAGD